LESESNNRSEGRSNVFFAAILETQEASNAVRIRNLSCRGALVEGPVLPSVGAKVRLLRGSLSAKGVLAWRANRQGGVNFDQEIDVNLWAQRFAHAGQQRVDAVIEAIRRHDAKPDHLQNEPARKTLMTISAALDQVCERLLGTANMSVELAENLLKLEAISQSLRNVARTKNF
jgi:hypothetical protein